MNAFEHVITPIRDALSEAGLVTTDSVIQFRYENVSETTGMAHFRYIFTTDNPQMFLRAEGRLPHEADAGHCGLTFGTSTDIEKRWDPIRTINVSGNLDGEYEVNSASFRTDVPEELELIKILIDVCLEVVPYYETMAGWAGTNE